MTHPQVRPDPVARVRAAGGRADEPERKPFGLLADCIDDQGATFRRWQPPRA